MPSLSHAVRTNFQHGAGHGAATWTSIEPYNSSIAGVKKWTLSMQEEEIAIVVCIYVKSSGVNAMLDHMR